MSERNDGGLAERGGGGIASPGGPNTASGGGGANNRAGTNTGGASKSDKSAGTSTTGAKKKQNFSSTYGELLPGARAPVVPGFGYTNRKNQTLGDIQEQNRIGNANFNAGLSGSNNAGGITSSPLGPLPKRIINAKPPIPGVRPVTTTPPTEDVPEELVDVVPPLHPYDPLSSIRAPSSPYPGAQAGYNPNAGYEAGFTSRPGMTSTAGLGSVVTGDPMSNTGPRQNSGKGDYQGGGINVGGRQFGGPVGPGQYTVGENGPETLQLGGGSRGQVIPNNPVDRRAGLVAALQGGRPGGNAGTGITGMGGGLGQPGRLATPPTMAPPRPMPQVSPGPAPRPMAATPMARPGGWQG